MISKFLLIVGTMFAAIGLILVLGNPASADFVGEHLAPHTLYRTAISFMLFAGGLHLFFVALRINQVLALHLAALAVCQMMAGMVLAGNPVPFVEASPAGSVYLGIIVLGLILFANGITMVLFDGRQVPNSQPAASS